MKVIAKKKKIAYRLKYSCATDKIKRWHPLLIKDGPFHHTDVFESGVSEVNFLNDPNDCKYFQFNSCEYSTFPAVILIYVSSMLLF